MPPRRGQAALEEDGGEPGHADGPGEVRVVEGDAAGPVRAQQHPEREERDQRRHGEATRRQGGGHGADEHRAHQEEQEAVVDARMLPRARPLAVR